jgi:hypothetical protein
VIGSVLQLRRTHHEVPVALDLVADLSGGTLETE